MSFKLPWTRSLGNLTGNEKNLRELLPSRGKEDMYFYEEIVHSLVGFCAFAKIKSNERHFIHDLCKLA